jgi:hypothetical protein
MRELLPSLGYSAPLRIATHKAPAVEESPYHVFFNLYKPSTPFKKSTPPEPDFQIVVIKYVAFFLAFLAILSKDFYKRENYSNAHPP